MSYPQEPTYPQGPPPPQPGTVPPPGYQGQPGYAPQPAPPPYPGGPGQPAPPGYPAAPGYGGYPGYPMGGAAGMLPVSTAGKRFGAYLLDILLAIVTLGIGWLIWSLIVWTNGQSPAKALLGMRCIRTDTGRAATWGTMALRELVGKSILGYITLGITTIVSAIMILSDNERHQGVWDKIANTVVVEDPNGQYAN